jgi:hypothetical protein
MCRYDHLRIHQDCQPQTRGDHRYQWTRRLGSLGRTTRQSDGKSPLSVITALILKGYKVVGIDARQQPIDLVKGSNVPPDLVLDASKTSVEEAQKEIAKLRPADYVGWPGVDGTSLHILGLFGEGLICSYDPHC